MAEVSADDDFHGNSVQMRPGQWDYYTIVIDPSSVGSVEDTLVGMPWSPAPNTVQLPCDTAHHMTGAGTAQFNALWYCKTQHF